MSKTKKQPRKSKYTPERVEKLCNLVREGNYKCAAAKACGISRMTLNVWESKYPEFKEKLLEAESAGESNLVKHIASAAEKTWTAAAWLLERKYHDRWGRRDSHKHQVEFDKLPTDEQAIRVSEALTKLGWVCTPPIKDSE